MAGSRPSLPFSEPDAAPGTGRSIALLCFECVADLGEIRFRAHRPAPAEAVRTGVQVRSADTAAGIQWAAPWPLEDAAARRAQGQPGPRGVLGVRENIGQQTANDLYE